MSQLRLCASRKQCCKSSRKWLKKESVELLRAKKVRVNSRVPIFLCPKRERDRGEVVRFRNGISVFCQIDRAQIMFARVAALDANVRKLFRDKHGQLVFSLLSARRAQNSAERPFMRAKRAVQKPPPAVA